MSTRTLLVADDSQTVHRIVEMAFAGEDIEVLTALDGERAIAKIDERHPDIVLADIGMPGRSGYEVAAFVKGRADLAHIPVMLMAGMFEAADEVRARGVGCAEVIVKPLKPHHVVGRVKHWLEAAPPPTALETHFHSEETAPAAAPAPATTEDYFSRLDEAFKNARPSAVGSAPVAAPEDSGAAAPPSVPTLQELLSRLPEETRTRLTPGAPASAPDAAVLDAIAARIFDRLSEHPDLLEEIAKRVAKQIMSARDR